MSSKRNLKKLVRYMCGDIAAECIIARDFIPGIDASAMNDLVIKTARVQAATLDKITFAFDKVASDFDNEAEYKRARNKYMKKAYRSLKIDFNKQVNEIVKEMNAVLPQAQKDLNKKLK